MPGSYRACRRGVAAVLLLGTAACAAPAPVATVAAPISPGAARIWIYRNFEPSVSLGLATIMLNGAVLGYSQPDGSAFYRDVAPGSYTIAVQSYGQDTNQMQRLDLRPGQQAYVKVAALGSWASGGGDENPGWSRDTFYVYVMPPQVGEAELARHPLASGGG
jgi:hypothetical protein